MKKKIITIKPVMVPGIRNKDSQNSDIDVTLNASEYLFSKHAEKSQNIKETIYKHAEKPKNFE